MKKLILLLLLFSISFISLGQQFLWTTNQNGLFPNSEMKVISKEDVLDKLLDYYETYNFYYDGSGFTKDGFFRMFQNSNSYQDTDKMDWEKFKKGISEIQDLTIICMKSNEGSGSNISILILSKNNFDMIRFSNQLEEGGIYTYNSKSQYERMKFIKFYNSLIVESWTDKHHFP